MIGHRLFFPRLLISLFLLLFLFSPRDVLADDVADGDLQSNANSSSSVHAVLSGLSDEQVRQLLITELQKDAAAENLSFSFEPEIKGPAAPLAEILTSLNEETFQAEDQLRKLWLGIPNLLPDLYKTFISL